MSNKMQDMIMGLIAISVVILLVAISVQGIKFNKARDVYRPCEYCNIQIIHHTETQRLVCKQVIYDRLLGDIK